MYVCICIKCKSIYIYIYIEETEKTPVNTKNNISICL